jgi:hypothetical protein
MPLARSPISERKKEIHALVYTHDNRSAYSCISLPSLHLFPHSILIEDFHHIMGLSQLALLACLTVAEAATVSSSQSLHPVRRVNDSLPPIFGSTNITTLKGNTTAPGVVIFDYGANVEGHPTFEVLSAAGDTSGLEITYSETKAVLDSFYTVSLTLQVLETYTDPCCRAMVQSLWPQLWTTTESISTMSLGP